MHPENFAQCERNCLPLKVFKDLFLQGGVSFDVQSLFSVDQGLKYAWLASLLLNVGNISSLNNLPVLKRQLGVFLESEVEPAIILAAKEGNKALIIELVKTFKAKITD